MLGSKKPRTRGKSDVELGPSNKFCLYEKRPSNQIRTIPALPLYKQQPIRAVFAPEECAKLDKKIDHYRSLMARVTDQLTNEGLGKLVEEMKAQKAALHPEQKPLG